MELILVLAVFALDQITKYWIQLSPSLHGKIEMIPNFFYITYVKNTGAAWSMFSGQQAMLSLLATVVIGVILYVLLTKKNLNKMYRIALCLMIAGAAGNLFDRLVIGAVRDFLDFYIFGYDFPIFNVADISLCIGVGLMIIDAWISDSNKKKENK